MINSDSLDDNPQMAIKIGLFEALKYALKIHAASEKSDHSLDYSCTCITTIDNPVTTELLQKQVNIIAKNWCLEEGMNSLKIQL